MIQGKFESKGRQLNLAEVQEAVVAKRRMFTVLALNSSDYAEAKFDIGIPDSFSIDVEKNRAAVKFPMDFFGLGDETVVNAKYPKGVDIETSKYISDIDNDITFYEVVENEVKNAVEFYEAVTRISEKFHNREISAEEMAFTIDRFWNT